jgi:hypothetical protein
MTCSSHQTEINSESAATGPFPNDRLVRRSRQRIKKELAEANGRRRSDQIAATRTPSKTQNPRSV